MLISFHSLIISDYSVFRTYLKEPIIQLIFNNMFSISKIVLPAIVKSLKQPIRFNYGVSGAYGVNRGGGYGGGRGGFGGGPRRMDRFGEAGSGLQRIDWGRMNLPEIAKNLYAEHPAIAERDEAEIHQWLNEGECTLDGNNIPRPILEFGESGFPQPIIDHLYANFERPTVIQSITWPVALTGQDLVSIGKTGSGKTLGFILPAIIHTLNQAPRQRGEGPSVLVMLPTRELACQVEQVAREFCQKMGLAVTCCYGGAQRQRQAMDLQRGVDIILATPGRILDFLEGGQTNMRRCTFLVLDEADRMLDMGFEPQIRKIVSQIRPDRQTLMFSATWPKDVRELAADFQQNPVHLQVGSLDLAANRNIQQNVEIIDEYAKLGRLQQLLSEIMQQPEYKTLIFVQMKRKADEITRRLRQNGLSALCIHGDKSQAEREWVLGEFRNGKAPIVIATDIAARGLDVNDIKYVINYDYPNNAEDYVHRIGRTARHEKKGTSYTFFTPSDGPRLAKDLIKVMEKSKQIVPDALRQMAAGDYFGGGGGGGFGGGGQQDRYGGNFGSGGDPRRYR